jgi:hypothetical protein
MIATMRVFEAESTGGRVSAFRPEVKGLIWANCRTRKTIKNIQYLSPRRDETLGAKTAATRPVSAIS